MPRACTICTHSDRETIDNELVSGASFRKIAERFGTNVTALHRHKKAHVMARIAAAEAVRDTANADTFVQRINAILAQMDGLRNRALDILNTAEQANDLRTALQAIREARECEREARECTQLLAKLVGELQDGVSVNVLLSADWLEVRAVILNALRPYPEARQAVARAPEVQR
jgi:transposase-like protein